MLTQVIVEQDQMFLSELKHSRTDYYLFHTIFNVIILYTYISFIYKNFVKDDDNDDKQRR